MEKEELTKMMTSVYKIMASSDFTEAVSTMMWNIYVKMKVKGFTEEQAMEITLHFARSMSKGD